jgi:hypothetical protein
MVFEELHPYANCLGRHTLGGILLWGKISGIWIPSLQRLEEAPIIELQHLFPGEAAYTPSRQDPDKLRHQVTRGDPAYQ